MREKLIECYLKSIDKCLNTKCRYCDYFTEPENPKRRCQAAMVVDDIIANGVTLQKWIPVTERLPEEDKPVLAWTNCGSFCESAKWTGYRWEVTWDYEELFEVTHWMPLPDPPKGE